MRNTPTIDESATLDRTLRPRSVAVLGASPRPGALSGRFITGLDRHGYEGRVIPVNPKYEEILGHRAYPTVVDAAEDGPVDLAIISLAKDKVLAGLEDCARAGAAGALIFASGYGEVGEEGRAEQEKLSELSRRTGLRLIGPNSPGFINVTDRTCTASLGVTFRERFEPGGVGIIGQSGGVTGLIADRAQDAGIGLSVAVSTGNEADLTVADLLPWYAAHEGTRVVAMFVEGLRQPQKLRAGLEAMRDAGKHVVILKAGATEAAARATAAHTGALVTPDDVVESVLQRHGVVRVYSIDDLVDTSHALEQLGSAPSRKVGIITTSGGVGVVATEAAERAGLELPAPSPSTAERLSAVMPEFASLQNPSDMSGMFAQDPEIFRNSLAAFGEATEFDSTVLILTVHPREFSEELADRLIEYRDRIGDPPAILWMAGEMNAPAIRRLRREGLAVFEDPDRCMRALAARAAVTTPVAEELPAAMPATLPEKRQFLEDEALALLSEAGVPVTPCIACTTSEEAAAAARDIGGALVIKAAAPDLAHKSDAGAVMLGIEGPEDAAAAHRRVVAAAHEASATPEGSVVQPMAEDGFELIVGARRDPAFGAIIAVGPGGLAAELAGDTSRRLLPLRRGEAEEMLRELRSFPLLDGYRGMPRADVAAAAGAIEALGSLAVGLGSRLEAVEVNPLIVHHEGQGATAVDALVLLDAGEEG